MRQKINSLRIIAEKPDTFGNFPESIMTLEQLDALKKIPRIAMGEICGAESMEAVCAALNKAEVDAFLPTIVYTGSEYGAWHTVLTKISTLKKKIEKTLQIYCLDPILVGAPEFWWALNGRFMHELIHRFTFYSPCLGCRLYRYAVRVPLCKQLNCMVIVTGSIFVNPATATIINTSQEVMYYCKTLLSNFGINLMYNIVDEEKYKKRDQKIPYTSTDKDNICSCCIFKDNYRLLHSSSRQLPDNKKYFEQFAIPAAAKIISRVLAGKKPDYLQEIMNTILPGENIKTNQAYIK